MSGGRLMRRRDALRLAIMTCVAALVPAGLAHAQPKTPPRGSAERKAILDAVRPRIEAEMRGPVEFVVNRLSVEDGWAFASLDPQRPGGAPIDPAETGWADDIGMMDGLTVWALMRRRNGQWHLVDSVTGPTDVAFAYWPELYGAPRSIFGFGG